MPLPSHLKNKLTQKKSSASVPAATNPEVLMEDSAGEMQTDDPIQAAFAEMKQMAVEEEKNSIQKESLDYAEVIQWALNHPDFSVQDFVDTMESMRAAILEASSPDLPQHCSQILKNLQQYEELSYLLTPDQVGVITNALIKYSGIVVSSPKKSANADDLRKNLLVASGGNIASIL